MSGIKRDQADIWFSKAVRHRDGHTCQSCSKGPTVECAHIIGRANKSTRWDLDNAVSLCHYCHRYYTANPIDFYDFIEALYGYERLDDLREKKRAILKTTKETRKYFAKHYRDEVRKAEANHGYTIVNLDPWSDCDA